MQWLINRLEAEQDRLFLWAPVLLALGIALYFHLKIEPWTWLAVPLLSVGAASAWFGRNQRPNWGLLPLLIVIGFAAAQLETNYMATPMLKRDLGFVDLTGIVDRIETLPEGRRVTLVELTMVDGKHSMPAVHAVRLIDRKGTLALSQGDKISTRAFLRSVSESLLPGDYDFRRDAYFAGLSATGYIAGPITINEHTTDDISFERARKTLESQIFASLDDDEAAISDALLTGDQTAISEATLSAMRLSGLTHILSVSGLHIGLAASLVFFLVRAILATIPAIALRYPIKKWAAITAMVNATAYTIFAGAPVPAVRSLLMTGIALAAIVCDRSALSLRTVALSATLILLIVPHALLGPSFQLSFAAITAIIAAYEFSEPWRAAFKPKHIVVRAISYVGAIAITSLIASLATAPLTHYHFQQLSFYGVIANMLAVPLTSFWLMPAALLALFLLPFGLSHWPLLVLGKGVRLLIIIAERTANLPGADWAPANLPLAAVLCLVLGLIWLVIWNTNWRWAGVAPICLGMLLACFPEQPKLLINADGHYAALRTELGYYLLSDTGRRHSDSFTPDQWRRWLGIKVYLDGGQICDGSICASQNLRIIRDPNILPEICGQTSDGWIIYTAGRLKNCGPHTLDEPDLWSGGTAALYENDKIDYVQDHIGHRPWSIRQPYARP